MEGIMSKDILALGELPPNDIDRQMAWLFVACKMGKTNEATNEFLLYLLQACQNVHDQFERCYANGEYPEIVNAIPFISAELARLVNLHHGN